METTWKPIVAGVLNIIVGLVTLLGTFIIVIILVGIGGGLLAMSRIADLVPIWLSGFVEGVMVIIAILLVVFSALPLIGGIYAVQRKNWGWALAGSIVSILSSTIFGIVSTVLVSLSKNEFERSNRYS
ncbi:hypothetical protein ACFLU8_03970 [Chloroflexota bacterium]